MPVAGQRICRLVVPLKSCSTMTATTRLPSCTASRLGRPSTGKLRTLVGFARLRSSSRKHPFMSATNKLHLAKSKIHLLFTSAHILQRLDNVPEKLLLSRLLPKRVYSHINFVWECERASHKCCRPLRQWALSQYHACW